MRVWCVMWILKTGATVNLMAHISPKCACSSRSTRQGSFKQDKKVNCYVILLDLKLMVGTNFTEHSLS
jgi:hypothetical protein